MACVVLYNIAVSELYGPIATLLRGLVYTSYRKMLNCLEMNELIMHGQGGIL